MNEINEGIRLNHYEDKKFKTNTINVFLRTKLTREDATKTALLADTLKLGCRKYPTQKEINIQLEKLMGSVFDISIVKKGGEQIIYFYMEVLTGESNFNQAMDIVREVLYRPLVEREKFNSEIVVKAKTRLKEELKSQKDSKAMYALDRMAEELSKNIEGENFGIPPLGYLEEVDKINEHCLFEHYNKIITSAPIDIYVVGKEKADTVVNCCRNAFNNTRYNIKELPLMPFKQTNNTVKEIRENLGTNQGKLCVCYSTAKEQTKENIVTLLVLNEILGGGANSHLFLTVREAEGLCYSISSFVYKFKMLICVQAGINKNDYEKVVKLINEGIQSISENCSNEDLQEAKDSFIKDYEGITDLPTEIVNYEFSMRLLGINQEIYQFLKTAKAVTVEDVKDMAKSLKAEIQYFLI